MLAMCNIDLPLRLQAIVRSKEIIRELENAKIAVRRLPAFAAPCRSLLCSLRRASSGGALSPQNLDALQALLGD